MNEKLSIFTSPEGEALFNEAYEAMFSLWPVAHEAIDVDTRFGTTHINVCGPEDAQPLFLLHAAGFSSTVWFANIEPLSQIRRVFAVDIIGDAGKSRISKQLASWGDHADWMSDVLDGLAIDQADILGHSQGGWMATAMAIKYAPKVSRLILLAPAATIHPFAWYVKLNLALAQRMIRPKAESQLKFAAAKGAVFDDRFIEMMEIVNEHCLPATMVPTAYSDEELENVTSPTLLLIGEKEKIYKPAKAIKRATKLMPDVAAEIIPGCSHLLIMEQPELVNERVVKFLQESI